MPPPRQRLGAIHRIINRIGAHRFHPYAYPCLKITGDAHVKRIDCVVWLESCPMHFGGERWYALCPNTGKRCTMLALPPGETHFASVSGWGLSKAD